MDRWLTIRRESLQRPRRHRRHPDEGPDTYRLPRTLSEQDRLDLQHHALRRLLGSHLLAPVEAPRQILDVGTGTGIWTHEAARRWPQARIVALDRDLRLLRPLPASVQPCEADRLSGLPFRRGTFDDVHQRLLGAAIALTAWPGVLLDLVRVTASGGWLELVEASGEVLDAGPLHTRMHAWVRAVARRRGLTFEAPLQIPTWLAGPGLHPQIRPFAAPLSGQAQGGALFARDLLASLLALAPALATVNEVPLEQVQEVLIQLPEAWARCGTRCGGLAVWAQVRERAV